MAMKMQQVGVGLSLSLVLTGYAFAQNPGRDANSLLRALDHKSKMMPADHLRQGKTRNASRWLNKWAEDGPNYRAGLSSPRNPATLVGDVLDVGGFRDHQWAAGRKDAVVSGRVNAIAFANKFGYSAILPSEVVYAATAHGGIMRGEKRAGEWVWSAKSDKSFPTLHTSSVAVDPVNPNIVYAGLGDYNRFNDFRGGSFSIIEYTNALATGVMKSFNGGDTWVALGVNELSGLAISGIVVDPVNPRIVVVTAGRGVNKPGGIFRSTDGGLSWTNVTPAGGAGDWSSIQCFDPFGKLRTRPADRVYYASAPGKGVFRSTDQGRTWRDIDAPIRFHNSSFPPAYMVRAAPSGTDPKTVYVIEGNAMFSDGRIYVGRVVKDGNSEVYLWTDITGTYPTFDGVLNNWHRSDYANALLALPSLAVDARDNRDLVVGANSSVSFMNAQDPTNWKTVNPYRGSFTSPDRVYPFSPNAETNLFQHDLALSSDWFKVPSISGVFSSGDVLLANDSGIHGLSVARAGLDIVSDQPVGLNDLPSVAVAGAAFWVAGTAPNQQVNVLSGTPTLGVLRREADKWTADNLSSVDNTKADLGTTGYYDLTLNPHLPQPSIGTVARDDVGREYVVVAGGGIRHSLVGSPGVFRDVTPAVVVDANGDEYFNFTEAIFDAWDDQPVVPFPTLHVGKNPFGTQSLFTGRSRLWRFDPPATADENSSTGTWSELSPDDELAEDGANISAIATSQGGERIFVGTSDGRLWVTSTGGVSPIDSGTNPEPVWRELDTSSLPNAKITSITIGKNLDLTERKQDIIVTLAGTNNAHVYRCQDINASNILFTRQDGFATNPSNVYTRLPDAPVYTLVADPENPLTRWFLATEIGIFTTTDKGSTWYDAGSALGLPNVPVTKMDIVEVNGSRFLYAATYGRGIWKLKLDPTQLEANPLISVRAGMIRSGNVITATIRFDNGENDPNVLPAEDFRLTRASITVGTNTVQANPAIPGSGVVVGTIGGGQFRIVRVTFPAGSIRSGSPATFNLGFAYRHANLQADDPAATGTRSIRLRLP